jgi:Fic family protein
MEDERLLRLAPSAALKERRLASLASGREAADLARAERAVDEARLAGSLELAGETAPEAAEGLRRASRVNPGGAFEVEALLEWHAAASGSATGLRTSPRDRADGPPPCPPDRIRGRLENLEHWLGSESGAQLSAARQAALILARLVEILPFDDANGRVARLAASHAMARAGARAPILVGGDGARLEACLQAAFQLSTEPLVALLEEASERALDVAIRALEG